MKETINKCFIGCYNDLIKVDHIIEKGKIREKYYKVYLKFNNFNKREIYFDKEIKSNISLKEKILKKISPRILWHLRKFLKKGIFSENFNGY